MIHPCFWPHPFSKDQPENSLTQFWSLTLINSGMVFATGNHESMYWIIFIYVCKYISICLHRGSFLFEGSFKLSFRSHFKAFLWHNEGFKDIFLPHSFSNLRFEESEKCSPQLLSEISLKNFHSDFSQWHLFTAQWCAFLTKLCAFVSITFLWTLSGISPPECSHGCPVSPTPAWSDAYKMWTGQKPLWGTWPMIHLMASWFCKNIHYLTSGMFRLSLCFWACSFFFCIVAYGGWIIIGPDGTQILPLPSNLWTIWIRTG